MNEPTLGLIKSANATRIQTLVVENMIRSNLSTIAEQQNTQVDTLVESVTHILANIAATASDGAPLKLMHLKSIAAFMAGVEAIATALPKMQDQAKVKNIIHHLQSTSVGPDGFVTTATAPIAQLGTRKPELMAKYDHIIKEYVVGSSRGQADGRQLMQAARKLQGSIDQAMRAAS